MTRYLEFQPGETLVDKFQVVELLGVGGFGVVYKVFEPSLQRHVAVKVLHAPVSPTDESWRRLVHEAQICSRLQNEHIVRVFSLGMLPDNRPYLVMDLCDGAALSGLGKMPWKKVIDISLQVLAGLQYAHAHGVIHRDLNPSNILLNSADQKVRILDFGLAKSARDEKLTATGFTQGTAHYMSPEQVVGAAVDARSDLYSWGCVMYELLAGKKPFNGCGNDEVMLEQLKTSLPRLEDVPPGLQDVLDIATAKDPARRYQSASRFADALRVVLATPEKAHLSKGQRVLQSQQFSLLSKLSPKAIALGLLVMLGTALCLLQNDAMLKLLLPDLFWGQRPSQQYAEAAELAKKLNRKAVAGALFNMAADNEPSTLRKYQLLLRSADAWNASGNVYVDLWNRYVNQMKDELDGSVSVKNQPVEPIVNLSPDEKIRFINFAMELHKKIPPELQRSCKHQDYIAYSLRGQGRYRESSELFAESARQFPNFDIYSSLGNSYISQLVHGDPQQELLVSKAEAAFGAALKLDSSPRSHYLIGSVLLDAARAMTLPVTLRLKYYQQAIREFEQSAVPGDSQERSSHEAAGQALYDMSGIAPTSDARRYCMQAIGQFNSAIALATADSGPDADRHLRISDYHHHLYECYRSLAIRAPIEDNQDALFRHAVEECVASARELNLAIDSSRDSCQIQLWHLSMANYYFSLCGAEMLLPQAQKAKFLDKALSFYQRAELPASEVRQANASGSAHYGAATCYEALRALSENWEPDRQEQLYNRAMEEVHKGHECLIADLNAAKPDTTTEIRRDHINTDYYYRLADPDGIGDCIKQRIANYEKAFKAGLHPGADCGSVHYYVIATRYGGPLAHFITLSPSQRQHYMELAIDAYERGIHTADPKSAVCNGMHLGLARSALEASDLCSDPVGRAKLLQKSINEAHAVLNSTFTVYEGSKFTANKCLCWAYLRLACMEKNPEQRRDLLDKCVAAQQSSLQLEDRLGAIPMHRAVIANLLSSSEGFITPSTDETRVCYDLALELARTALKNASGTEDATWLKYTIGRCFLLKSSLKDDSVFHRRHYAELAMDEFLRDLHDDSSHHNSCIFTTMVGGAYCYLANIEQDSARRQQCYRGALRYMEQAVCNSRDPQQNWIVDLEVRKVESADTQRNCRTFLWHGLTILASSDATSKEEKQRLYRQIVEGEKQANASYLDSVEGDKHQGRQKTSRTLSMSYDASLGGAYVALGNLESDKQTRRKFYQQAVEVYKCASIIGQTPDTWCAPLGLCYLALGDGTRGRLFIERARCWRAIYAYRSSSEMHNYRVFLFNTAHNVEHLDPVLSTSLKAQYDKLEPLDHEPFYEDPSERELLHSTTPVAL